jgi:dTMP kinase
MTTRGKFIAIEGIDGSGKRTQLDLLAQAFDMRGISYARFSFPRYESSFGKLVARYLNGDFGSLASVDAHLSALLYAGDRFESKRELESALAAGKTIIADRYIGSNLAHQTARVAPEQREEFLAWLKNVEYGIYGLPKEDLVLYMRLNVAEAHRLVGMKQTREYTPLQRDLHEADTSHLEQASSVYDRLARETNWATIECMRSGTDGGEKMLAPETIHASAIVAIDARVLELGGDKNSGTPGAGMMKGGA